MAKSKKKSIAVTGHWLPLPLDFLRSRACAELSPHALKLLVDLLSMMGPNASRNGDLCIAPKVMAVRGWSGRASLLAAAKELLEHRLIVQTRQGSRLDCSLFACTLFPLDCDLSKLDVRPGCYGRMDYVGDADSLANAPTESNPARWRRARKTQTVAPPRYKVPPVRTATVRSAVPEH